MMHATSLRLRTRNLWTITTLSITASLLGCVPTEEPEQAPTVIIIDEEDEVVADPPICGDGLVEGDEVCDDGVNDGLAGSCLADCSAEGTSTCGNGALDPGEHCDGTQGMVSCTAIGFDGGGTSECTSACQLDISTCTGVRRLPRVNGSPRGVSPGNRYAIYIDRQRDCDESACYADPGEPGSISTLDLVGGQVIEHGGELATVSLHPIDAERFWIVANWDREDHFGQLQIRRFDNQGEPVIVANRVPVDHLSASHPTHLSFVDQDGIAWVVPHGEKDLEKVFVADRWITSLTLGPDGRTALVEANTTTSWLDLDGGRVDFDGEVSTTSPDGRWAVVRTGALEYQVISMADGSVVRKTARRLESAEFSASSNYLYVREEACTYQSRTSVIALPDGEETLFGECAHYRSRGLPAFTEDDRWLMQARRFDDERRSELLFTDLDTRVTTTIPYRFVAEDQQLPVYSYEPTSEQVVFTGVHTEDEGRTAHRLELATGELQALPESFEGASAHNGGWIMSLRTDDTDSWTWDRYILEPDGTRELLVRRSDWFMAVPSVPDLYVVERANDRVIYYVRRGEQTLQPLAEDGHSVRSHGPFLIWDDYDGTWLTIPR